MLFASIKNRNILKEMIFWRKRGSYIDRQLKPWSQIFGDLKSKQKICRNKVKSY